MEDTKIRYSIKIFNTFSENELYRLDRIFGDIVSDKITNFFSIFQLPYIKVDRKSIK